jgi:hypothetical protein
VLKARFHSTYSSLIDVIKVALQNYRWSMHLHCWRLLEFFRILKNALRKLISVLKMCGAIPPLPSTPLWHGAQFNRSTWATYLSLCRKGCTNILPDLYECLRSIHATIDSFHAKIWRRNLMEGAPLGSTATWSIWVDSARHFYPAGKPCWT